MEELIETLHNGNYSCVVRHNKGVVLCHGRGVSDLYKMLNETPQLLKDSQIADKIVGKGAAALIIMGGVSQVYADVISEPAKLLFEQYGISPRFANCVPNIINRDGSGICPVEQLCEKCTTPEECIPLITEFITKIKAFNNN